MFKHLIFLCFLSIFISCDDPTTDLRTDAELPTEPIDDAVELSQIIITDPDSGDVITDIAINYDADRVISTVVFSGNQDITYDFEYANNNRLIGFSKNENGTSIDYELEYESDDIRLIQEENGITTTRLFEVDAQNRIFRTQSFTNENLSGSKDYDYTANFNVERVNERDEFANITSYQDLTYFFNNNPFRDMNDVLRFIVFEDFIPYTRFLPASIDNFELINGFLQLESNTLYEYTLNEDDFPMSRTVARAANATTVETLETFIYADN